MPNPSNAGKVPDPSNGGPARCSARRSDGEPCRNYPVKGAAVCGFHGGRAPQVAARAGQRVLAGKAAHAAVTLGLPADITPHDALLEEVARSAGAVRWLEARVRELDPGALTLGQVVKVSGRQAQGSVEYTERRTGTHPLLVTFLAERKHLTDVCRITIAAGIEERRVQLAERLGGIVADVLSSVLDDLDLTTEQQAAARESVPRRLTLLAGNLSSEGIA